MMSRFMLRLHQQAAERSMADVSCTQQKSELVFAPLTTVVELRTAAHVDPIDGSLELPTDSACL